MVERFLLDRVDAKAARAAVAEQLDTPCLRATHEAQASLPITQLAGSRAHVALHTAVVQRVPVARVDDRAFRRPYLQALRRLAHARNCAPVRADQYSCSMRGATAAHRSRRPAVAGVFYPRDPQTLRTVLAEFLAQAIGRRAASNVPDPARRGRASMPKALIAPHAGYVYSGPIAASAYSALGDAAHAIERVVLIGPSHYVPFSGLAVQLPFLQVLLGDFRVLPIAAGAATAREVAAALQCVWGNEETLIVVSSDLSHYLEYAVARSADASTAQSILNCSTELGGEQACGCVGINGLMDVARARELEVRLLDLRNSGDTTEDRARVVGYGAFALYEPHVMG